MSAYEIVIAAVVGIAALTFLYALVRVPWRLRRGAVEPAGRDSDTFRRKK